MTHMLETTGPTIDEQITAAAAQVIYARMTEEEKAEIGTEGMFGALTVEEVREAVRKAGRQDALQVWHLRQDDFRPA